MTKRVVTIYSVLIVFTLLAVLVPSCTQALPDIQVKATLDGSPWEGAANYTLTELTSGVISHGISAGKAFIVESGSWTCAYVSGGPSGAYLDSITPAPTQSVSDGGTITFTLNFKTGTSSIFYLPFDGNLASATGQPPGTDDWPGTRNTTLYPIDYRDGIKGSALMLDSGPYTTFAKYQAKYQGSDNFDKQQGTVEFWVMPKWNIEEPISSNETGRQIKDGYRPYFSVWNQDYLNSDNGYAVNWSRHVEFLRIEQQHGGFEPPVWASVQYWNVGEWHHIALSWKKTGQNATTVNITNTVYIDGKPRPARISEIERTKFRETPGWIVVGQYLGTVDAVAAIDELKIYDKVLTETEIRHNYRELFPVDYYARDTVFYTSELGGVMPRLTVNITNPSSQQISGDFAFAVTRSHPATLPWGWEKWRKSLWEGTRNVVLPSEGSASITIPLPPIQEPGEYYLYCAYVGQGTQSWMRIIRLFAISDQEQPSKPETRNLTLDLDWSNYTEIDCWLPTSNEIPYFETGGTDVVTFSGGLSYRRTGTKEGDRFGYQFPVKTENLGKPHVVVVEYPALDKQTLNARTMEIDIIEPQGPVIQTGVFTGGEYPCGSDENQWKQHRIIFWPQHEKNLITIVNRWAGHRAGAICIYIFPILEDEAGAFFPKTNVMTPPGYEGRLLGLWWEEPTIPREFGVPVYYDQNGSPYYGTPSITDFHEALEHMIDYLHYTGQNLVVYPIYFYDDPVYPSRIEGWPLHGEKGLMHPDDWFELMLKMCEANDISVIASFTMKSIPSLEPDKYFLPGRDGGEYKEKWESLLEQRAHDIFDEVLDEYGDLPALKGLSFNVWGQPDKVINVRLKNGKLKRWFDSVLWMDYSDTDYGNICGSIGECRSDLKLVISEWLPYDTDIVRLPGYLDKVQRIRDIYDQAGVRLNHGLTSRWERIRIERVLRLSFYRESLSHGGGSIHLLNAFFTSQDYYQSCYHLFWKENNTAAAIYNGYFEGGWNGMYSTFRDYFYKTGTNDQWEVFKRELGLNLPGQAGFWRRAALTPGYRYFMQYYTLAMANLDPIQIGIGGSTVGTVGHDVRLEDWTCSTPIEMYGLPIQNFAKAYRALPAKSFDDVQLYGRMEGPDPYELGFARKDEDDGYFYIMNRTSHTIWARLTFKDGKANMTDLTTGATMEYDREDPQVVLQPYELKSFRFNGTEYSLDHVWLGNPTT